MEGNPATTGMIFSEHAGYFRRKPFKIDEFLQKKFPSLQHLIDADMKQYRIDYYSNKGGMLMVDFERLDEAAKNKQEKKKFEKEYSMCHTLAINKHNVDYLKTIEGRYDILIDNEPAELKCTSSHNHIVDYAKKAMKQGAKYVIFEKECDINTIIRKELSKVKALGIPCYYFTSKSKKVKLL